MTSGAITVTDNEAEQRYEIHVDGALAEFVLFRRRPGVIAFIHTEIDPGRGGEGLGSALIVQALDAARAAGQAVLPFCPFVHAYIERHREYVDLVPPEHRRDSGTMRPPTPAV